MRTIQTVKHIRSDINNKSNHYRQYITKLELYIGTHSSHYAIIKCVDFEPIKYSIILIVATFFKVFREFDFVFPYNILLI